MPKRQSKIEKLIAELCPEGVEFKELGFVCKVFNGYAFKAELFNNEGDGISLIRIRDVNTGFSETFYSGDYDASYLVGNGDILIGMDGDFRAVRWKHGPAILNQRVCRLQDFSSEVLSDFMYFKVQDELNRIQKKTQGSTVKHLSSKELERSLIPIPPLAIQQKIVNILDTFTTLEAELEAQLEAELKVRKQQYEYYRDELLTFGDDVEWKTLREVGKWFGGGTPSKSNSEYWRDGIIPWLSPKDMRGPTIEATEDYITESAVANSATKMMPASSVAIVVRSSILDKALPVAFVPIPITLNQDMKAVVTHAEILPKYISYILRSHGQQVLRATRKTGGSVASIEVPKLMSYSIPIPPLTEQHRIVAILDKFDALVNDISVGLPAELKARRKQYEYYRNKLLTFNKVPSSGAVS